MENRELKELLTALADGQSADWDALFHEVEHGQRDVYGLFFRR